MRIGRGRGHGPALLGLLVLAFGLSVAAPASARTQAVDPCGTVTTRAADAGTVLVGTTTSVADGVVDLRVTDVYKGAPGGAVRLTSSDPTWQAGRQYLVFAAGTGPRLTPDRCGTPVPVTDDVLAAVAGALGPATPLGRGAGIADLPSAAPTSPSATPTTPAASDGDARAANRADDGTTTSKILLGIVLGLAILGSFLLPQLRRHNRERRRRRREGTDAEPVDPDLSPEWRDR